MLSSDVRSPILYSCPRPVGLGEIENSLYTQGTARPDHKRESRDIIERGGGEGDGAIYI